MTELPAEYRKAVNQYKPIEVDGLTLYPIRVYEYEMFLIARESLGFMAQTLPFELLSVPLLEAYFKLDIESVLKGERAKGLFPSALLSLALALRLIPDGSIEEKIEAFEFVTSQEDPTKLKHITFEKDGERRTITPFLYSRLRPIIAAQNGVEIISENANPELVEADYELRRQKAPKLKVNLESMVQAVCALASVEEEEVYDWTILKLDNRLESFKRIIDYVVCGIGESQGTSWKGGNPYPHPWFEKDTDNSSSLIALDSFAGGQAMKAIQEQGGVTPPQFANNTTQ